ncbi:hypothetical protein HYALB_00004473 [Hymenoscyphus albidus]|uniref:Protein ROT1 n=2 Tax=Hymenoscyphus TaxID=5182 RepID=A0A9N9PQV0_9HELO|nr:hypothetical protein HYFRA_00001222 [Hymenoscyphus fraxineus]CAG8982239.1 hypothetical protein HYALB_00004473 [Hymenoscyphus albidus]
MPSLSLPSLLIAGAFLATSASAAIDPQLVGTWSSKSAKVITGPGFYNPVNDSFIEPTHTGISYSFTEDGFYESAYYRAVSNRTYETPGSHADGNSIAAEPQCPMGMMQWQHGTVVMNADLSLSLTPFTSDGRQLQSNPCTSTTHATFTRYNQSEVMAKWQVYEDPYTKMQRLDLYMFDGSPIQPLFLAYKPPMMLPTQILNPTAAATGASKAKRTLGAELPLPLNQNAKHVKRGLEQHSLMQRVDLSIVWWTGLGMIVFGGTAYML